jgi:hypothetical protein
LLSHQPLGYYICTGLNPTEALKHHPKFYGIWEISSIVLHLIIHLRIHVHKKKLHSNILSEISISQKLKNLEPTSFASFAINLMSIVFLISTTFMLQYLSKSNLEDLSKFPNYLFLYFRSLALPGFGCIFLVFVYFVRHSGLQHLIIDTTKSIFNK